MASVLHPRLISRESMEYVGEKLNICTVIGFPLGYNTTEVKKAEVPRQLQKALGK